MASSSRKKQPVQKQRPETGTDFEQLFRQAPSFFAVLRGETHIFEQVNEAYLQFIRHREVLGKPLIEAFPEIRGQGFIEQLDEVFRTGVPFSAQGVQAMIVRVPGAAAEELFVDFAYQPLRRDSSEVVGILVHGADVTSQSVARREAEDASRQVVEVLSSLSDSVTVLDRDWRCLYFNPAAESILRSTGKDPAALIGKVLWDVFPHLEGSEFQRFAQRAADENVVTEIDDIPGSNSRIYEMRFVPSPGRITIFSRDITARRESEEELRAREEQFRTAMNAIPALAWIAHADGWIFWYNRRWYEYTGTTEQDMEGWGWQSVHDPAILPVVLERWTDSISTGEPFEMEFPLRSATGELRWFLTRVSPLRDHHGRIQRWFGTNTDVHAQREAAEAARAANQAKSDFLAAMSHETRQPINATIGFLGLLDTGIYGQLTEEQRDVIKRVRANQDQLLSVITDILSFARLEAGKVKLELEPVDCSELLVLLPALVEPQIQARGLDLVIEPGQALLAFADRNRVLQILTNLVTNAARATEKPGAITVTSRANEGFVAIEVKDTGVGIPAQKLEAIFAPFVQLDRTLSQPREGVGLGLAISRDLAIAMGGTLTATSSVGVGSVFTLTLESAS